MSIREMPLERLLSKAFLRPWELSECDAARMVLAGDHSLIASRFGYLRLGLWTWESPGCGNLPKDLDAPLLYWQTPWQSKIRRPISLKQRLERRLQFRKLVRDFRRLVCLMSWNGWVGPPVPGILLTDADRECFIHTDGNRRIGIAAAVHVDPIPVRVSRLLTFDWKATRAAGKGRFSEADTQRIWEHVWGRVDGTSSAT